MKRSKNPILRIILIMIVVTFFIAFTYETVLKPYVDGEKVWWYLNAFYGAEDEAEVDIAETELVVSDTSLEKIDDTFYKVTFTLKNNSDYNIKICGVAYDVYKYSELQRCDDFQYSKRIKSGEEVVVTGKIERENFWSSEMAISGFFADVDRDFKTWLYLCDEDMMKEQRVKFEDLIFINILIRLTNIHKCV